MNHGGPPCEADPRREVEAAAELVPVLAESELDQQSLTQAPRVVDIGSRLEVVAAQASLASERDSAGERVVGAVLLIAGAPHVLPVVEQVEVDSGFHPVASKGSERTREKIGDPLITRGFPHAVDK